jgi:predicted RNase H-like HicB family nuclease
VTNWNILIEPSTDGQTTATVLELPSFQVKASDRETALKEIQRLLAQRLASAEVVSVSIPAPDSANPWLKYGGMFKDDADFEAIAQELQQERQQADQGRENCLYRFGESVNGSHMQPARFFSHPWPSLRGLVSRCLLMSQQD